MNWISVKDRLPIVDTQVLITNGDYVEIGYRRYANDWYRNLSCPHRGVTMMRVTHWMPLPAPPKEETEL